MQFVIFNDSRKLKLVNDVSLKINFAVDRSDSFKYLVVLMNQTMLWSEHIDTISTKINQRIRMIKRIRHLLPLHAKLIRPGSYVAFLPCRMQFKPKIMKQIISLSIVSIAFDTAEMRRMNRA